MKLRKVFNNQIQKTSDLKAKSDIVYFFSNLHKDSFESNS